MQGMLYKTNTVTYQQPF